MFKVLSKRGYKMKNKEVCQDFVNEHDSKTKNLFSEETNGKRVLYSYGYHFPLCVVLGDGTKLFNSSGYSATTSQHKGDMARAFGFDNFKDLVENLNGIILFNTDQLKQIIDNSEINSQADLIEGLI